MPNFWWVNHNQTVRQEIVGQYLWSPKREKNARSQFYDNMRLASPGDMVLSYSGRAIRYVGRVADFALSSSKPDAFGKTGTYWDTDGWLLPIIWTPLSPAIHPKDIIGALGPLLPNKYSPISALTGSGHQKAYLAHISREAFNVVVASANFSEEALDRGGAGQTFRKLIEALDDGAERQIIEDVALASTTKEMVIQARRGQGKFRTNVESVEQSCRLTGISNPSLLIASHIKPWRLCSSAHERLDGMNGLLLTPDADLLFDRGFVSFGDDGEVLISSRVPGEDLRRLGFGQLVQSQGVRESSAQWRTDSFKEPQNEYLSYHRSEVFLP